MRAAAHAAMMKYKDNDCNEEETTGSKEDATHIEGQSKDITVCAIIQNIAIES